VLLLRGGCSSDASTQHNRVARPDRDGSHAPDPADGMVPPVELHVAGDGGHAVGLREELVGTFELVGLESRRSDGEVTRPYGEHPIGLFMFDSVGRYSVQLTDADQPPDRRNYLATFGTYVVAEADRTFTLTPRAAADPQLIGTEVVRHVTFEDDLAIFHTPTTSVDGFDLTTLITWRRVTST
jgi:hypothetical protein